MINGLKYTSSTCWRLTKSWIPAPGVQKRKTMLQEGLQLVITSLLGCGLIDYLPGCGSTSSPSLLPLVLILLVHFVLDLIFIHHSSRESWFCKFYPLINDCLFLSSELVWDSFFKRTISQPSHSHAKVYRKSFWIHSPTKEWQGMKECWNLEKYSPIRKNI